MQLMNENPTREAYKELERAYAFFNGKLFANRLPLCIITMHRHKGAYGYFWARTWADAEGKTITDEIALNPDHFRRLGSQEVLSTLVHEMCHLEQHHFGDPSRAGYHNKEWARMMEAVGLIPSSTGKPGGKKTGQHMSHYIAEAGPFDRACRSLLAKGGALSWHALTGRNENLRRKKQASKTKYTCAACGLNAWAKPGAALICGKCNKHLTSESPDIFAGA